MMRCFRIGIVCILLAVLFFTLSTIAQSARPFLVKVSRDNPSAVSVLREQGTPVHYKFEKWFIAQAGAADLEQFESHGIEFDVLDETAWTQPYYVLQRPQRKELGVLPDLGRILFQDRIQALVKIESDDALELARAGFQLTKIFQKGLPLFGERSERAPRLRAKRHTEDVIGALVNQVSQESVQSYVQTLQDFQTRLWASEPIWPASQWIYDTFVELGYADVAFENFVVPGQANVWFQPGYDVTVRNVVATKPGILYPDIVYIIGGHYDSINLDGIDTFVWAPGADDNASGAVGALEAARVLADIQLDCTVKFACWTAEEIGLRGSRHYAENAYDQGENIALYINYDMIGNLSENDPVRDINIGMSSGAQEHCDLMVQMINQYTTLVPNTYVTYGGGSDHSPFIQYGFDILYAEEGDFSPHWHRSTDIVENMDIPYFCEVVKMGLATLAAAAGPPESYPEPVLAYDSSIMDDDNEGGSCGNHNGYFDPGETVQISVALINYGGSPANDVHGALDINDPYVSLVDCEGSFGDISSGASSTSLKQFCFDISEHCPIGHCLNFSLDVTAAGGYEWTTYFTVQVTLPDIVYNSFSFEEIAGNGDGMLNPGETVNLKILLNNRGLRGASGITLELETDDPDITVSDRMSLFPDIGIDAVVTNSDDPFTFSVSEDAECLPVVFTLHLTEGDGYYETDLTFRLLVGQCLVLLVPDDGGANNGASYIEAFRNLGVPFVVDELHGTVDTRFNRLSDYSEVIWFTGAEESNTLSQEDQNNLEAFLDGGGRLFISGSMIGYEMGHTPFYRNYLHGDHVSFLTMLHHLDGSASNPVVGEREIRLASFGRNAQGFAGETDPISPAVSIFDYDRATEEGSGIIRSSGSGALAVETAVYKVVYFSFGLEGVEPFEDRVRVLADVLAWFKEPGIAKGDVDGNGTTDIIDAVLTVNIVLGVHQPDEGESARADMNYDGAIDVLDAIKVVSAVLGSSAKGALSASKDS
ncbi:MAG: M20/M25/M40 family metallo-hydrolase [Gemmatimonadota bacterium]|nr:MAG: M20/M25/M40 family metallo-hydrolase [Gemmatimonadota bacterium]